MYVFGAGLTWLLAFALGGSILLALTLIGISMARRVNKYD